MQIKQLPNKYKLIPGANKHKYFNFMRAAFYQNAIQGNNPHYMDIFYECWGYHYKY